jgi:hypothetical protein
LNCPNCKMANPEGAKFCLNCGNQLEAHLRVEGERKYVTVLFADVVDSTGLGERLDPEQVAEIMNGAFAFFDASVCGVDGLWGGVVNGLRAGGGYLSGQSR